MQFRNVSGDSQDLPTLDVRVADGDTFTATGDAAKDLLSNPAFARVDTPAKSSEKE